MLCLGIEILLSNHGNTHSKLPIGSHISMAIRTPSGNKGIIMENEERTIRLVKEMMRLGIPLWEGVIVTEDGS